MKIYTQKLVMMEIPVYKVDFRIAKSHPRILAYGTVDEANAMPLALVLSKCTR